MGLNDTPSGERIHIGFFGQRNAGKSSLVNAFTGQELSVVSDVKGTTTDPVYKAMELLPLGPVEIIDTPGFDDSGELGELRVKKTRQILAKTDIAVLVTDSTSGENKCDSELISLFEERKIPYIRVYTKSDISGVNILGEREISVSAAEGKNIGRLKEMTASLLSDSTQERKLIADKISRGDVILLVIPIDEAAPKGRLILPQQMMIRDILDSHACAVSVQVEELENTLKKIKPALVITDSQAFGEVNKIVPREIPLTSFSILMARYRGFLETAVKGAYELKNLRDGDRILISEGCTHHRQCGDIGSVKLPKLLKKYTGCDLDIQLSSGRDFPTDLSGFKAVIHCGGCMLNAKEMEYRQNTANQQGIPFTNYGISIACMNGILDRSVEIFGNDLK